MRKASLEPATKTRRRQLTIDEYVDGVLTGDRTVIARAITLVESRNPAHFGTAQGVLVRLLPHTGKACRVGITGSPGVGKSTFIETLGMKLVDRGRRVAVLAVDPSSSISGGSILADKTRMVRLATDPHAFIRPSPSALSLGGVTRRTRETMLLCEAAGFDVVLVETVGVGQSETMVADMVDFFLVLMLPGAGDELQGIKKGIMELADVIAVNKADGDNKERARLAQGEYSAALNYLRPNTPTWKPEALSVSGLTGTGLDELWALVERHRAQLQSAGELDRLRREQQRSWMWSMVDERLMATFRSHEAVKKRLPLLEQAVLDGKTTATQAVAELLTAFGIDGIPND